MSIDKGIKRRFPNIRPDQYVLQDDSDGRGPYVKYFDPALGTPPTIEELESEGQAPDRKDRDALIRRHLDDTAEAQGFESMLDAVSYADEPTDPARQALGAALRAWRSTVMLRVDAAPPNQPGPALIRSLPDFPAP